MEQGEWNFVGQLAQELGQSFLGPDFFGCDFLGHVDMVDTEAVPLELFDDLERRGFDHTEPDQKITSALLELVLEFID
jgi:hypothetical protein